MKKGDALDPKGLIYEAYQIAGITKGECRSIFLDWALSMPVDMDTAPLINELLARYRPPHPKHPMTAVLVEGLGLTKTPQRRGGRKARVPE